MSSEQKKYIGKQEYIQKRRKNLLIAFSVLTVVGVILFALSFFNETNTSVVPSGGLYNFAGKLKKSIKLDPSQRQNILKEPLKVRYKINLESDELTVQNSFMIGEKKVSNAIFSIKEHKNMLYSEDFSSDDKNILCRGVMKKNADYFFIYFCSDKRD